MAVKKRSAVKSIVALITAVRVVLKVSTETKVKVVVAEAPATTLVALLILLNIKATSIL